MRKLIIIVLLIICLITSCNLNSYSNFTTTSTFASTKETTIIDESIIVSPFSVDDHYYREYLKEFPSNRNIGDAHDPKTIIQKAEEIWIETYGVDALENCKPYKIYFDNKNNIWLVTYTLPPNTAGGGPCILIDKITGNVLAIWQEK